MKNHQGSCDHLHTHIEEKLRKKGGPETVDHSSSLSPDKT